MMHWTGLGCDVCGYGTIEDVDNFDPCRPCPDCGEVMQKPIASCDQCGTVAFTGWKGQLCPSVPYGSCDGKLLHFDHVNVDVNLETKTVIARNVDAYEPSDAVIAAIEQHARHAGLHIIDWEGDHNRRELRAVCIDEQRNVE